MLSNLTKFYERKLFVLYSASKAVDLYFMLTGYERILTFKKPDGSYGAWTDYPTSTW